jgi:Tfp pilus assembly protein PilN
MIQFNLLPDIKLEYIKAARIKRMVILTSVLVSGVALALVIGLAVAVYGVQKRHMTALSTDITAYGEDLTQTEDLNKVLTVQNQLRTLTGLHDQKQATTRILPFVQALTPTDVSIASLNIDYEAKTMTITGTAESPNAANKLASVNQFVDTLKFTNFSTNAGGDPTRAFSSVVLTSFGRADKGASYTINVVFDDLLFSNVQEVTLQVPTRITTRSTAGSAGALFEEATGIEDVQ